MSNEGLAILVTLVAYQVVLVLIGVWASRRTRDEGDYFLGGRRLGALVAAISASASSSSAWSLLGVSGAAYLWGLSALWLFPATVGGFLLNWLWVAPRLRRRSHADGSLTLTEFLAGPGGGPERVLFVRLASLMILFSFSFYVASQFQGAGDAFASTFGMERNASVLVGAAIVLLYVWLGGFWAVSVTDTVQGLVMAVTAAVLPLAALVSVGGVGAMLAGLDAMGEGLRAPFGRHTGAMAVAFVAGTLGIGLGYPGQPHVVNRFMALEGEAALRRARAIAIAWAVVVYAGMLLLGWCGRVMFPAVELREAIFFTVTNELFHPVVAGVMIAAVLSAVMSTADSQLLVAGSSAAYDLRRDRRRRAGSLLLTRATVLAIGLVAVALTLFIPQSIFERVLFAWHALGSAFGPLVLVRLSGRDVPPRAAVTGICLGFGLTVAFHLLPAAAMPGDAVERLLPFLVCLAVAIASTRPARGPR